MINFDFYTPTRVLFGADRENEAGKQVAAFGGHKVTISTFSFSTVTAFSAVRPFS